MIFSMLLATSLFGSLQAEALNSVLMDDDVGPHGTYLSRDGKKIAVSGGTQKGGDWKILDLAKGGCAVDGVNGKPRRSASWGVCLSHDGGLIGVGGTQDHLSLVNANTAELVWEMGNSGHLGAIEPSGLLFTPDDKFLISVAGDMMVRVWDIGNKKPHAVFRFTSTNPRLNLWKNPSLKEGAKKIYEIEGKYHHVRCPAVSPESTTLAVGGNLDGKVPFLDLATGKTVKTIEIKRPAAHANCLQFTPDGKWLVVAACELDGKKGTVEIWDLEKDKLVTSLASHERAITHLALSPDKKTLITGGVTDGFRVWDVSTGKQKFSYFTKEDPRMPREKLYPDGSKLIRKQCRSAGVAFLPDGKTFLFVPGDWWRTEIYFHDTATGEPVDYRQRVKALPKIDAAPRK